MVPSNSTCSSAMFVIQTRKKYLFAVHILRQETAHREDVKELQGMELRLDTLLDTPGTWNAQLFFHSGHTYLHLFCLVIMGSCSKYTLHSMQSTLLKSNLLGRNCC